MAREITQTQKEKYHIFSFMDPRLLFLYVFYICVHGYSIWVMKLEKGPMRNEKK